MLELLGAKYSMLSLVIIKLHNADTYIIMLFIVHARTLSWQYALGWKHVLWFELNCERSLVVN